MDQSQNDQRRKSDHDQEELQNLIVDGRGEPSQIDINQYDHGRNQQAEIKIPAQQGFHQQCQGIHGDPGSKYGHDRKRKRIESPGFFIEPEFQVFGHRPCLGTIIKRHHEDGQEYHGRDGPNPVKMYRRHTVFRPRGRHTDHFQCPQVGGDKGEPGDPGRNGTPGLQEICRGFHIALEGPSYPQYKSEIDQHDRVVDPAQCEGTIHRLNDFSSEEQYFQRKLKNRNNS